MQRGIFGTGKYLGLILAGSALVGATSAPANASTILDEDFTGETTTTLQTQGWSFSGSTRNNGGSAEAVKTGFAGDSTDANLRLGGDTGEDSIFAEKSLGSTLSKGSLSFTGGTASSTVRSKLHLQDANGNNFFTHSLTSDDVYRIEDVSSGVGFVKDSNVPGDLNQKGIGATHYAQVDVQWDGSDIQYRVQTFDTADNMSSPTYDSGLKTTTSKTGVG